MFIPGKLPAGPLEFDLSPGKNIPIITDRQSQLNVLIDQEQSDTQIL